MADRYWVGGTGIWNGTNTANWSTSSGGTSGAAVPTSADNVFFNGSSGGGVITQATVNALALNLDFTGYTGDFGSGRLTEVYGSLTLATGMTHSHTNGYTLRATDARTITTAGLTIPGTITIASTGSYTLQDDFTITGQLSINGGGSFDANDKDLSMLNMSFLTAGTIDLGTGTWTMTSNNTQLTGITTLIPSSSTLKFTYNSSLTFAGGSNTFNNIWFTAATTVDISGSNTFNDFKDTNSAAHTIIFGVGSTTTVATWDVSGTAGNVITINRKTTPLTTSGSIVIPSGVTSLFVETWGGGAAGGGTVASAGSGGGGAGGQYAAKDVTVTPTNTYNYAVAAAKSGTSGAGTAGNDTTFNGTDVVAKGGPVGGGNGTNGAGGAGSTTGGVGDVVYAGGDGVTGISGTSGGNGGGGAGSTGSGSNGTGASTAVGGGGGGAGKTGPAGNGGAGSSRGGGGGGGRNTTTGTRTGGNGAIGGISFPFFLTSTGGPISSDYVAISNSILIGGTTGTATNSTDDGHNANWSFGGPADTSSMFLLF